MDYRIKSFIKARRCVETARRRCVFKIYNVTRLKIFAPQTSGKIRRVSRIQITLPAVSWEFFHISMPSGWLYVLDLGIIHAHLASSL